MIVHDSIDLIFHAMQEFGCWLLRRQMTPYVHSLRQLMDL